MKNHLRSVSGRVNSCRTPGCTLPENADHRTIHATSNEALLKGFAVLTHRVDRAANPRVAREQRDLLAAEILRRMS